MGSPSAPRLLQVVPGGPCDKGRDSILKPQDRLLSVDGVPVSAPGPSPVAQHEQCALQGPLLEQNLQLGVRSFLHTVHACGLLP
jgi:hypothetical protein